MLDATNRVRWRTPMTNRTFPSAWFAVFASLSAPIYAAEPEFQAGLVTESRTYEREQLVRSGGPNGVMPIRVSINRVTVALEGERITGEWKPGLVLKDLRVLPDLRSAARALARDFPGGTSVRAATDRNQLLLQQPDGTVVRARIVDRVNSKEGEGEGEDERD
jgi:hypothetical protein